MYMDDLDLVKVTSGIRHKHRSQDARLMIRELLETHYICVSFSRAKRTRGEPQPQTGNEDCEHNCKNRIRLIMFSSNFETVGMMGIDSLAMLL